METICAPMQGTRFLHYDGLLIRVVDNGFWPLPGSDDRSTKSLALRQ